MILVLADQLNLSFLLRHQGNTLRATRSATEALYVLRTTLSAINGVIMDDRIANSRLVTAYLKAHAPELQIVPWRIAERNSPFMRTEAPAPTVEWKPVAGERYQHTPLRSGA